MKSSAAAAAAAAACAVAGVVVGRRVGRSRKWRRAMMEDLRAAAFYLSVGEIDDASRYYMKSIQVGSEVCVDKKIAVEASEGVRKAKRVSECMNRAAELLLARAPKDVEIAIELIAEALTISLYSEKLLEMKAEALFMMGRYEEVVQLCEQTIDSAEKNSMLLNKKEQSADPDGLAFSEMSYFRVWRGHQMFKSYFRLGRLEEGLVSLDRQELWSATNSSWNSSLASLIPLVETVRESVPLKAAGNEAFQAGKHAEAVRHYTAALSCNIESRPFAATCFCNRAAAYKAMGQITDAIADCSFAIALDGNYLKAIHKRASLFETTRNYEQAVADLQRLRLVLTRLVQEKTNQSGTYARSLSSVNELEQALLRLPEIEEAYKKKIPLDMYLILGVEPSASPPEIKKAYRNAALRHHPDKVSQVLAKGDNGDDKLWKRMAEEANKDADMLFKMIGEAYATLSEPNKRLHYDLEEERRNSEKKRSGPSTSTEDDQNQPFERSGNSQQGRDASRFCSTSQAQGSGPTHGTMRRSDMILIGLLIMCWGGLTLERATGEILRPMMVQTLRWGGKIIKRLVRGGPELGRGIVLDTEGDEVREHIWDFLLRSGGGSSW